MIKTKFISKMGVIFVLSLSIGWLSFLKNAQAESTHDKSCGLTGTISERINDCYHQLGDKSQKEIKTKLRDTPKVTWTLVESIKDPNFTKIYRQIWLDESSHLIWSDRLTDKDTHKNVYVTYWGALSACADPTQGEISKGKLDLDYRVPSKTEFETAHVHGLKKVLPGIQDSVFDYTGSEIANGLGTTALNRGYGFWTSTSYIDKNGQRRSYAYDPFPFPLFGHHITDPATPQSGLQYATEVICVASYDKD